MSYIEITRIHVFFLSLLAISSCSLLQKSPVETLNALVIENNSTSAITNVTLRVPETKAIVECGYIPSQRECSLGFSPRANKNNPAMIYWKQDGKTFSSALKGDATKINAITDHPVEIVIKVMNNGKVIIQKR